MTNPPAANEPAADHAAGRDPATDAQAAQAAQTAQPTRPAQPTQPARDVPAARQQDPEVTAEVPAEATTAEVPAEPANRAGATARLADEDAPEPTYAADYAPTSGSPFVGATSAPPSDSGFAGASFPASAPPDGYPPPQPSAVPPFNPPGAVPPYSPAGAVPPYSPAGAVPPYDPAGAVPPYTAPGAAPPPGTPPFTAASAGGSTPAGAGLNRQHLIRPTNGRYLAGVCAAIARATNTDPTLWRVLLAVLTLFGGVGLLAYLLGWLLIPAEGDTASPLEAVLGRGKSNTSVPLAVVIAAFAVLTFMFVISDNVGPAVVGLAVVLGTVALLLRNQSDKQQQPPTMATAGPALFEPPTSAQPFPASAPPFSSPYPPTTVFPATGPFPPPQPPQTFNLTPPTSAPPMPVPTSTPPVPPKTPMPPMPAVSPLPPLPPALASSGYRPPFAPHGPYASTSPYAASLGYPTSPASAYPGLVPQKKAKPPKVRSRLGRVTLSLAMLALGVMTVLEVTVVNFRVSAYFAVVLAMIGLGLLVGAWVGRARVLILLGVVMSIGLAIATASQYAPDRRTVENLNVAPESVENIAPLYETDFGDIVLNLSHLNFTDRQIDVGVYQNVRGNVRIILPPDVDATIEADIGGGDCTILGRDCSGFNQHEQVTDNGADGAGGGRIHLSIDVRYGNLEVTR